MPHYTNEGATGCILCAVAVTLAVMFTAIVVGFRLHKYVVGEEEVVVEEKRLQLIESSQFRIPEHGWCLDVAVVQDSKTGREYIVNGKGGIIEILPKAP